MSCLLIAKYKESRITTSIVIIIEARNNQPGTWTYNFVYQAFEQNRTWLRYNICMTHSTPRPYLIMVKSSQSQTRVRTMKASSWSSKNSNRKKRIPIIICFNVQQRPKQMWDLSSESLKAHCYNIKEDIVTKDHHKFSCNYTPLHSSPPHHFQIKFF